MIDKIHYEGRGNHRAVDLEKIIENYDEIIYLMKLRKQKLLEIIEEQRS